MTPPPVTPAELLRLAVNFELGLIARGLQSISISDECIAALRSAAAQLESRDAATAPIPMILPCPACGMLHVDAPEPEKGWANPPHKSHLCHGCGTIWRPADIPTTGVSATATKGSADTWPLQVLDAGGGATGISTDNHKETP